MKREIKLNEVDIYGDCVQPHDVDRAGCVGCSVLDTAAQTTALQGPSLELGHLPFRREHSRTLGF